MGDRRKLALPAALLIAFATIALLAGPGAPELSPAPAAAAAPAPRAVGSTAALPEAAPQRVEVVLPAREPVTRARPSEAAPLTDLREWLWHVPTHAGVPSLEQLTAGAPRPRPARTAEQSGYFAARARELELRPR